MTWTYHRRTGGNIADVPGGGHAVEVATVDGQDYARTRRRRPIGGRAGRANEWDYVCAGTDRQLRAASADDPELRAMLAGFGVA